MNYFATLPSKTYDIEKDKKYRTVTDIGKRVGIRSDMNDIIPSYYKTSVVAAERPELVSDSIYGDVNYHWVLMQLNNVIDPYYDWVMEDNTLEEFVDRKYPNFNLLLHSDHFLIPNSYNDTSAPTFFHIGETITGDIKFPPATGTVIDFDPTLRQVVYKAENDVFANGEKIVGSVSNAVGRILTYSSEPAGIHHYESSAPEEVGLIVSRDYVVRYGTTYYEAKEVTNREYENNRNEEKREISILNSSYIQQYIAEFKEKITK